MNSRRAFLQTGAAAVAAAQLGRAQPAGKNPILIGVGSSSHQVEGGNSNNDLWFMEHAAATMFPEKSGDAVDQYHLYAADIKLLAQLGFRAYRFSVEWSRVEPEKGEFSQARLDHYRRIAAACRENGIAPLVTLHHFSSPMWMARAGAWEKAESADLFGRYVQRVARALGDLPLGYCTINEINVPPFIQRVKMRVPMLGQLSKMLSAKAGGEFSTFLFCDAAKAVENLMKGHSLAMAALRSENGRAVGGLTLAMRDHQPLPGGEEKFREIEQTDYLPFLELARKDDFVGVQSYTRTRVGPGGEMEAEAGVEKTESGSEYYPQALENTIRYAAAKCGRPVYVTENGIPTKNDEQRIRFIGEALAGLRRCLHDGIDVRGYFHWSAFDSFEFVYGYRHPYGLIAVDRKTFARTPKKSAEYLGAIARRGEWE